MRLFNIIVQTIIKTPYRYFIKSIIIIILFIGFASTQFSIVDKQIYDSTNNTFYSDDKFIEFLNNDPQFIKDESFLKYKKYVSRLKFNKSKYVYLFSFLSIGVGIDGIQNPEEHIDDDSPPGVKNIVGGILLSSTYYGYNNIKKTKALYDLVQKYNVHCLDVNSNFIADSSQTSQDVNKPFEWNNSFSFGLLSEKTPVSIIEYSGILNINNQSEYYLAIGSMLFGSGIGFGYKYYFNDKIENSPFISIGSQISHLGTADSQGMTIYGLSISPGYSKEYGSKSNSGIYYREGFGGPIKEALLRKSSINFGVSFLFFGDGSYGALPYINIEKRF